MILASELIVRIIFKTLTFTVEFFPQIHVYPPASNTALIKFQHLPDLVFFLNLDTRLISRYPYHFKTEDQYKGNKIWRGITPSVPVKLAPLYFHRNKGIS